MPGGSTKALSGEDELFHISLFPTDTLLSRNPGQMSTTSAVSAGPPSPATLSSGFLSLLMLWHPLEVLLRRFHRGHPHRRAWWEFLYYKCMADRVLTHQPLPSSPLGSCRDIHTSCLKEVMTSQNAIKKNQAFPATLQDRVLEGRQRQNIKKRRRSCCFTAWHLSIRSLGAGGLEANGLGINYRFGGILDRSESGHSASG